MKVLYLEDSDIDIDLVRRFIQSRSGFDLTCLNNEHEALQFLKNEHPDVFLVHTIIQGEAVHNLVELAIKKGFARIVIPLAAGAGLEELRFYKGLGCPQIISKPFTVDDLTRAFESISAQPARVQ